MHTEPIRILIKYCGGCNPTIDRVKIVKLLMEKLKDDAKVTSSRNNVDIVLLICGCPTSCINEPNFAEKKDLIIVSGAGIDYTPVEEAKIPDLLAQEIKNLQKKRAKIKILS